MSSVQGSDLDQHKSLSKEPMFIMLYNEIWGAMGRTISSPDAYVKV